jgi:hypothetical protein
MFLTRLLTIFVLLTAVLVPATQAQEWEALGGQLNGTISCMDIAQERLECFVRGANNDIWNIGWREDGWSGWEGGGGILSSPPSCDTYGPGKVGVVCAATSGPNATVFGIRFHPDGLCTADGSKCGFHFGDWWATGFTAMEAVDCIGFGDAKVDCFGRTGDMSMGYFWSDNLSGAGGVGADNVGGAITGTPECVSRKKNTIQCFARGTDGDLWLREFSGTSWKKWASLGGEFTDRPSCTEWSGRIDCFVRGMDGALWHTAWQSGELDWGSWDSLGGAFVDSPSCTSWGKGRIDCFVHATDDSVWHIWGDGTNWGEWEGIGGLIKGPPECISRKPNTLNCFVRGVDDALWHKGYDVDHWVPE